jgi:hypothetical protein
MNHHLRSLGLLAIVLGLTLALPTAGRAQATNGTTNLELPVSTTLSNLCTGELVDFVGTQHLVIAFAFTPSGKVRSTIHSNLQDVSGTSQETGATFHFQGGSNNVDAILTPGQESTIVIAFRFIGPGPDNNVLLQEVLHLTINDNGEITANVTLVSLKCE